MKKFLWLLGLLALFTCVIACDRFKNVTDDKIEVSDSAVIAEYVSQITNPEFMDLKELFAFRNEVAENGKTDSIFMSLSDQTLRNVAGVLLNKHKYTTKKDIVEEYLANKAIYENLPTQKPPSDTDVIIDDLIKESNIPKEAEERAVSYNSRDTIIDGKKCRIETKTIEYE